MLNFVNTNSNWVLVDFGTLRVCRLGFRVVAFWNEYECLNAGLHWLTGCRRVYIFHGLSGRAIRTTLLKPKEEDSSAARPDYRDTLIYPLFVQVRALSMLTSNTRAFNSLLTSISVDCFQPC